MSNEIPYAKLRQYFHCQVSALQKMLQDAGGDKLLTQFDERLNMAAGRNSIPMRINGHTLYIDDDVQSVDLKSFVYITHVCTEFATNAIGKNLVRKAVKKENDRLLKEMKINTYELAYRLNLPVD